jgi:type IV secretory pathway VirB10-like protein
MKRNSDLSNLRRPGVVRGIVLALGIGVVGVGSFACAKAQAAAPTGPPLDVPAPPERVLAPVEEPVTASAPPPETPPPAAAAVAPRTPPRPPARREPEKPPEPAPAAATTTPPPAAPEQPRELRPASPAADAAAERQARDALARSSRDLARVDYGKLNADARAQYDQSKRFTEQAQQALRDRNFVFASTLADKAAALAAELVTR